MVVVASCMLLLYFSICCWISLWVQDKKFVAGCWHAKFTDQINDVKILEILSHVLLRHSCLFCFLLSKIVDTRTLCGMHMNRVERQGIHIFIHTYPRKPCYFTSTFTRLRSILVSVNLTHALLVS